MTIETEEEIRARLDAAKKFKSRDPMKIINATYFRDVCHANNLRISEEALIELANMNRRLLDTIIEDTKEMGYKVVLRRYAEKHIFG